MSDEESWCKWCGKVTPQADLVRPGIHLTDELPQGYCDECFLESLKMEEIEQRVLQVRSKLNAERYGDMFAEPSAAPEER
jgi:hypothetical protein